MPQDIISENQISKVAEVLKIPEDEAGIFLKKAYAGGDVFGLSFEEWFEQRFRPFVYFLDQNDYAMMLVDALKIIATTAGTDYGSSRQRDLAQLWADMTRGYLGELAFVKFLSDKFAIEAKLAHERGVLKDFLPLDVAEVRTKNNSNWRKPKQKIAIKTTKWNGIWFDIPGDQFNHSDIHVMVKVGVGRDSLIAYLKSISVFRDKVLKEGVAVGSLTKEESEKLYNELPSFKPVPAYIAGFVSRDGKYAPLSYSGIKGRIHFKVNSWNGPIRSSDLIEIKKTQGLGETGQIIFEGIEKFAHSSGYLFNTGSLLWKIDDWKEHLKFL